LAGVFSLQDMRASLREREARLSNPRDSRALEQVARTRRWLEEGEHRSLFGEAAAALERNCRKHGTGAVR